MELKRTTELNNKDQYMLKIYSNPYFPNMYTENKKYIRTLIPNFDEIISTRY
jgi:hypothetical protein